MRGELVALDLETTGLDHTQDAIIEVGAVRMVEGKILDEFSTFVDPGVNIPPHITHITGISSRDVAGAPKIETVLPQIAAFVGNAPMIAHNISLDMGFLQQRHGILLNTRKIDTYELATILMPRAARYNLNSLANEAGISLAHAHRALDDARATALFYWYLWERMQGLPRGTLQEIVDMGGGLNWDAQYIFETALQSAQSSVQNDGFSSLFSPLHTMPQPLKPTERAHSIDADKTVAAIEPGGSLNKHLPVYERREQQEQMARAIVDAFNNEQHLMVEAGTGTGKSIAYLLPAVYWATTNNTPVVVSTNTINLQDQLIDHDIPLLQSALAEDGIHFTASVLKGRGNYLCPRRLTTVRRRRPTSLAELRTLAKILIWLLESSTGDRGEISLRGPVEFAVWQRLSAEDEGCSLDRCMASTHGACPFFKARKSAEAAHVLIVNHALLISDAASQNRVLPDYDYLIIDEAHNLEDAITGGLTFRVDHSALLRRIADLGGPNRGLLGEILNNVRGSVPDKDTARLELFIQTIDEATSLMRTHVERYFEQVLTFLNDIHNARSGEYVTMVRITPQHRSRAAFGDVQAAWGMLAEYFEVIVDAMRRLNKAMHKLREYEVPGYEDFIFSTETAAEYLEEIHTQLKAFSLEPDANAIFWISIGQGANELPSVNSAPLHIGSMMDQYLWQSKRSVVLTSATLRTNDTFDFLRSRLDATAAQTLEVGSPFNYRDSTLIYIPQDMPEPNDKNHYQRAVERGIIELAAALNGRVLVLFTSYTHLRQTAQAIGPRLALGGITLYDQSDGSSRQALVEGFKTNEKAVLMGTRSFWEGVDIPGESLSALVITRLPFAVPNDPIFSARSEAYPRPFDDYGVPDAILRFRQGFGRLIRSTSDRGIVAIFDKRVISKGYGAHFLEVLPDCTVQQGPLEGLGQAAKSWLAKTTTSDH